jgi:hypothetical protein
MEALSAFHQDPAIAGAIAQGPIARKIVEAGGIHVYRFIPPS